MRDKQIEEMARVMNECCNRYDEQGNHLGNKCFDCECWCDTNHICCSYNEKEATALYNAGYRKSTDLAREIFEEIEASAKVKYWRGGGLVVFEIDGEDFAELKKKYLATDTNVVCKDTEGEG